jgi:hypothetical protein
MNADNCANFKEQINFINFQLEPVERRLIWCKLRQSGGMPVWTLAPMALSAPLA